MVCTFYAHKIGFKKLIEVVNRIITKADITLSKEDDFSIVTIKEKGGLFSASSVLSISYRERIVPSYKINDREDCLLNQNLKGLYGFVDSLPSKNEEVKGFFLQKIQTFNSEFSVFQEKGKTKLMNELIVSLAKEFEAVLFVQPKSEISKYEKQHFLNEDLNLIIDEEGNCKIDTLSVRIDAKYFDAEQNEIKNDQKKRKDESEIILRKHGVKINKHLPFVESEEEVEIRKIKEVATRVVILAFTNLVAFNNITAETAIEEIKKYNLWGAVTPNERSFLENPTEEGKNHETWKCEAIWALMWGLNIVEDLSFPKDLANLKNIPYEQYPIGQNKNPNDFILSQNRLRSKKEILDANDLYYRMSWASVDARINNTDLTEIHGGVVYERHYVFNWLINYRQQEWDAVSCDT